MLLLVKGEGCYYWWGGRDITSTEESGKVEGCGDEQIDVTDKLELLTGSW